MPSAPFLRSPLALVATLVVASAPFARAPAEAQAQPAAGRGDRKRACVDAYEAGQQLRNVGKLIESRERLLVCSNDECPTAVRGDCATWLSEVESNLPSVVVEARLPSGRETADVVVAVDGLVVARNLDGRALAVNPGVHTFRFESATEGKVEQQVIVRQGEKNRKIVAQFGNAPAAAPAPEAPGAPAAPGGREAPGAGSGRSPLYPTVPLVLAGVGVVGFGAFVGFALSGKQLERDLRDECAPECSDSQVDAVKRRLVYADVGLAAGAVGLVGAGVTYFLLRGGGDPPAAAGARVRFDLGPAPGGGFAGLSGRF
ncbi:MAG TPA: hypothetical protein VFS00_23875 [Polyangiaceae bacterium]|nr:hypothetical protein [Polyangiaceae bacterium]